LWMVQDILNEQVEAENASKSVVEVGTNILQ
jgi:hypothetical protein